MAIVDYVIVDAFASDPFTGNPAAVIVLDGPLPDETLQAVSREFNLPMTAFLSLESTDHYALRWFSPECEEAFCGHAILASAHFLLPAVDPGTPPANITFRSKAGQLRARRTVMGAVELDFPAGDARPTTTEELQQVKELLKQAMGDQATVVKADLGPLDVYIELKMAEGLHLRDAIIAQQPFPGRGAEDIVCASAHCTVGPLYATRFGAADVQVRATQGSARRSGTIGVAWDGKKGEAGGRVKLSGPAVTVAKGAMFL